MSLLQTRAPSYSVVPIADPAPAPSSRGLVQCSVALNALFAFTTGALAVALWQQQQSAQALQLQAQAVTAGPLGATPHAPATSGRGRPQRSTAQSSAAAPVDVETAPVFGALTSEGPAAATVAAAGVSAPHLTWGGLLLVGAVAAFFNRTKPRPVALATASGSVPAAPAVPILPVRLLRVMGHAAAIVVTLVWTLSTALIGKIGRLVLNVLDGITGSGKDLERPVPHAPRFTTAPIYKADGKLQEELDAEAMFKASGYPLAPETLCAKAKALLAKEFKAGVEEYLSDDFQFVAPVVGPLPREEFLKAIRGFDVKKGFPDLVNNYWGFHVDPMEPNRVWFFTRASGTHTGEFNFGRPIPPTGKEVHTPPQALSLLFDESGKAYTLTVGYSMDRRIGNTGGLGGLFGFLYAIGSPLPFPECKPWSPSVESEMFARIPKIGALLKGSA